MKKMVDLNFGPVYQLGTQTETFMAAPRKPIPTLCRSLLQQHGTVEKAAEALEVMAANDPTLYKELTANLLRDACFGAVRRVVLADRNNVYKEAAAHHQAPIHVPATIQPASASSQAQSDSAAASQQRFASWSRSLLNEYRIFNGKSLGDATKAELFETVNLLRGRATDMVVKSNWLERIAKRMDDSRTVRAQLTETEVLSLQKEALTGDAIVDPIAIAAE